MEMRNLSPLSNESSSNPENKTKEGVDFVFEQNPELASLGTKEQYSEYINHIFPDSNRKEIFKHVSSYKNPTDNFIFPKFPNGENGVIYFSLGDYYYPGMKTFAVLNIKKTAHLGYDIITITSREKEKYQKAGYDSASARQLLGFTEDFKGIDSFILNNPKATDREINNYIKKYDNYVAEKVYYHLLGIKKISSENDKTKSTILNRLKEVFIQPRASKDEVDKYGKKDFEFVVFQPEQIHILGDNKDMEEFKNFTEKDKAI